MSESVRSRQVEQEKAFRKQYNVDEYDRAFNKRKEWFIIELKYWIRKFETAEKNAIKNLAVKNVLIDFTKAEAFQNDMRLETIKELLPFLKEQLEIVEQRKFPDLRKNTILPRGSITAGEVKLQIAEELPGIAELTDDEWFKMINETTGKVAKLVSEIDPTVYMMDTTTLNSLKEQHQKENEEGYQKLMQLSEKTLRAIQNVKPNLPQQEKIRLQQESVAIQLKLSEFRKWFVDNGLPVPPEKKGRNETRELWTRRIKGAVTWIRGEMKNRPEVKQIDICREFLSKWTIKGKENLTPEQLSDNVSH